MKLDKEFLLKNRFWVLLGTAVLLWVVLVGMIFFDPAKKAAAESKKFAETEKQFKKDQDPKNDSFLTEWQKLEKTFKGHKDRVWERAWESQKNVMTWPRDLAKMMANAYFGDKLDPDSINRYKNTFYNSQFANLEAFMALPDGDQMYLPV